MTAQQLLDQLLDLQKQGFDLAALDVRATKLVLNTRTVFVDTSFDIISCEVDDSELILYND